MEKRVYGILYKGSYKMLGVRIDEQLENVCVELDTDVGNVWTTESIEAAKSTIENPASWFESTMQKPRHQFNSNELVAIELCEPMKDVLHTEEHEKGTYATGIITSIEMNSSTVLNFPRMKMIIECDAIVDPKGFTENAKLGNAGRVIIRPC